MRHWFKDRHFKSLLKNSGYLAVSKAVAAVAALATLAFAGRSLGLVMFGMLILITSYTKAASGLSKFQSWQLIVRYGGQALESGENREFKASTGFGLALDVVSGFGGMILAILLLPLIGGWFGIEDRYLIPAMLYCTLLPTMGAAVPVGVLRSLDRFDLLSWQGTVTPIARAILSAIAWWLDAPFEAFLAIWYVTDLGGDVFLWFLGWRELKRRDLIKGIRPTLKPKDLPGAWRFAIHVNLNSSLMAAWGPIARLIIGGLVGPAAAGIYRVAASLADSAQKPADLLARAYYPEIVRMDLRTKRPWKLMFRAATLAASVGVAAVLVLALAGRPLIDAIFGEEFLAAYPVLLILILAPLLGMISFPLPSTLYALDRPDAPLRSRLLGIVTYFIIVAPLTLRFGVTGAAAAYVIGFAVMVLALITYLRGEYGRTRGPGSRAAELSDPPSEPL
ncbi:MAG TPA: lipopolysaccharide biosynthesis protein [Sphingomicrobium sp.]|nr:lipopolysaccharide biosynthesis protein [Sphingomicrobium sp.]